MKPNAESRFLSLLSIGLLALAAPHVFGAGLAAIKEQTFHQDAGANIVSYSSLKNDGLSVKITTGSKAFTMEPKKLAGSIEVLSTLPAEIIADADLEPVRKAAKEYREFAARFPKSSPALTPHIAALDSCIKEFETGKARHKGQWMPKAEALAAKQKEQDLHEAELAASSQKLREKMEFEAAQKTKGLAKYNGKWLPDDEVRKLVERDQESLAKDVASAKQAEQRLANEKAILAASKDAVLRVISSDENGVLCKIAFFHNGTTSDWKKDAFGRSVEIKKPVVGLTPFSADTVYVQGVTGAVDGSKIRVNVVELSDPYVYQTVMGARATVTRLQAVGEAKSFGDNSSGPSNTSPPPPATSLQSVGGG